TAQLAALYTSIGRALAGTWQLGYTTAARPGDPLRRTATVPAAGSSERAVRLPDVGASGVTETPPSAVLPRSAWSSRLAPFALAAVVGLLALLAAGFLLTARSGSWLSARLAP